MTKMKVGFDIHGVLDANFDKYKRFINALPREFFEIHIVTGIKEHIGLKENPELAELNYDKWFSVHQACEDVGAEIKYDERDRPLVDDAIWDIQKGLYCEKEGLLFLIDDSPHYGQFFENCMYLQQRNLARDNWRHIESTNTN